MDTDAEFKIEYISPSIIQQRPHEFCLRYLDAHGEVLFSGYENGHSSGGMLYFLSPEDWDQLYPERKGQRELIRVRLLEYARSHSYFHFLEPSLMRAAASRRRRSLVMATPPLFGTISLDFIAAVVISLLWPLSVATGDDPLNIGLWYYVFVPTLVLYIGVRLGAPPPYLSAGALAVAASLLWYSNLGRPEDLPGVRHLASLPLALVGYAYGFVVAEQSREFLVVLLAGLVGWSLGMGASLGFLCKLGWCG